MAKWLIILAFLALLAVPAMAQNSTIYCNTNNTLIEILSVDKLNATNLTQVLNTTVLSLPTYCTNGCDNTTFSCKSAPMYEGFKAFAIIVGFIIIIVIFDKVILRR